MREAELEAKIKKYTEDCGGIAYKTVSPGRNGFPDRVCVFPKNRIFFVEVKRPGRLNGLSSAQKKVAKDLKKLGCDVWCINDFDDFKQKLLVKGVFCH